MYDVIVDHAKNHVWCAPLQDYDHTIMPARLSPAGGWFRYAKVIWNDNLPLPNAKNPKDFSRYHVYQIGKYPDFLLGVPDLSSDWVNLNKISELTDCFVNTFIDNGISLAADECWLRLVKPSNNIILAVKIDRQYSLGTYWVENPATGSTTLENARLDYKQLYIRFYSNSRLKDKAQRDSVNNPFDQVRTYTRFCNTSSDVTSFINQTYDSKRPTFGWLRVDGYVVSREWLLANPFTAVGKTLFAYHDDTIIDKHWFKLSDLKSFRSIKNPNVDKYIMFYGRDMRKMVYNNDVEYFLGVRRNQQFNGVYVPRFSIDTVTNVTHAIHALDSNVVDDLIENNQGVLSDNYADLWVYAVVRQGGMVNGLTFEANRITDMYRMSDEDIINALQDINSVLPEWKASNLEVDAYVRLMSTPYLSGITPDLIMRAYGYNALTKYMQPNINITTDLPDSNAGTTLKLPNTLINPSKLSSTILPLETIEYSTEGKFLGISRRLFPGNGELQFGRYGQTPVRKVEVFVNNFKADNPFRLDDLIDSVIENDDLANFGFRCYVCSLVNNVPNFKWTDVTGTQYYTYSVTGKPTIRWDESALQSDTLVGLVRINNQSAVKSGKLSDLITLNRSYGILSVSNQFNGWETLIAGSIELWVDGYLLHEDLDYTVAWPKIYIAKHIIDKSVNYTARISGVPDPNTRLNWKPREKGFVKDGILSVNNRYQTREDRNIQINVAGQVYLQSEVQFAENPITNPLMVDGVPYSIVDYITPIDFYSGQNTIEEKLKSLKMDEKVDNYLSLRLPIYEAKHPIVARGKRWEVVSIFFNEILVNLLDGYLDNELKGEWNNSNVAGWVSQFLFLLPFDIVNSDFFDQEYVSPMAHSNEFAVEVTSQQMTFLRIVNDLYLNSRVELEKYLYVKTNVSNG